MKYGPLKGTWMTVCRLVRCHPFSDGGYDPVKNDEIVDNGSTL